MSCLLGYTATCHRKKKSEHLGGYKHQGRVQHVGKGQAKQNSQKDVWRHFWPTLGEVPQLCTWITSGPKSILDTELSVIRDAASALQGRTSPGPWQRDGRGGQSSTKYQQGTQRESTVRGCVHAPVWALSRTCRQHMASCAPCFVLHLLQSCQSHRTGGEFPLYTRDRPESTFLTAPRKHLSQPGRLKRRIGIVFPSPPASATV